MSLPSTIRAEVAASIAVKQALLREEVEENTRHVSASSCIQPPGIPAETIIPEGSIFGTVLASLQDDRRLVSRQWRGVSRGTPSVRPTSSAYRHRARSATIQEKRAWCARPQCVTSAIQTKIVMHRGAHVSCSSSLTRLPGNEMLEPQLCLRQLHPRWISRVPV